jgi:hypothetical protein
MERTMNDTELIGEIQKVREKNNVLWMKILKLAVQHAPAEAKDCLQKITSNDKKISALTQELAND